MIDIWRERDGAAWISLRFFFILFNLILLVFLVSFR